MIGNEIFSEHELEARHEVWLEQYTMKLQIEARMLGEMVSSQILPATIQYLNQLSESVKKMKDIGIPAKSYKAQKDLIKYISEHVTALNDLVVKMVNARKKANKQVNSNKKSVEYAENVKPYFDEIRFHSDKLEELIDDKIWPLAKYRELLFIK